ncbi:MAG: undecaprenyl-diphosphatase UppP [Chloroflexi bacterium]|jgi:undecaprenyl-diphosphatase|nr:undecaprenyl-diphosphatase UppP [Chloroflexota bacterium]
MSILRAILLGLLQGLTEFLPVSSSGHLTLIPWLLHWEDPGLTFDVLVHLGTLIAIVFYFWADIWALLRAWWNSLRTREAKTTEARLAWLIILSAIPAALLGFFLEDFFEQLFAAPLAVSILLLVTGCLLWVSERLGQRVLPLSKMGWRDALTIGVAQGFAIAPGISRSGATISAGLLRGLERDAAARFSFLMVIPVIAGAAAFQLLDAVSAGLELADGAALLAGFVTAMVSGYVAIRFLLGYVRQHSLRPFAYYVWAVGLLGVILSIVR